MHKSLTILQISDLHILCSADQLMSGVNTAKSFQSILKHAFSQHKTIDLILVTGDLTQQPNDFAYQFIAEELNRYHTRTLCLPGNHDDIALMRQYLNNDKVNCDKQLTTQHWQVICLNSQKIGSDTGYIAKQELEYLEKQLKQFPEKHTLIAFHHNPIPTHSEWLDTMTIENADELFDRVKQSPQVKLMICGHIHQTLASKKENISILGCPSTCFQFKPHDKTYALDTLGPGYRILKLNPDGLIDTEVTHLEKENGI